VSGRPANAVRGEVALVLDGRDRVLRPGFERLLAAEAELGSLVAMLDRVGGGDVRLAEVEALFWHCLEGERGERDGFRAMLVAAGVGALVAPYRALLTAIFAGGA